MKRRTSQKIIKQNRKDSSSSKQLPQTNCSSDSLKAPKRKPAKKQRHFGDNITNLQKQPVFQAMLEELSKPTKNQISSEFSEIQPYLSDIGVYMQSLDDVFNANLLAKMITKSSDSTEVTLDMRKILVKWILQVGEKFKVNQQTVHIGIQIIDYILIFSHKKITKTNFQLLGISALFVASKYNQIYTPQAKKYVYVCDGLYSLEDLFEMESYILTVVKFNLQFPTLINFLTPLINDSTLSEQFKKIVDTFSKVIVFDFNLFNRYKKIELSGVILCFTAKLLKMERFDAFELMIEMDIDESRFKSCYQELLILYHQYFKANRSGNKE